MFDRLRKGYASTDKRRLSEVSAIHDAAPRRNAAWAAVLALGACVLASSTARASVYNPEHLAPDQISRIAAVCQTTMGLGESSTTQYDACAESLSHSFAGRLKAGRLLAARQDCLARGLQPGTTALSECELTARRQQTAQNRRPALETATPTPAAKSYFNASVNEIRRREQRACAEIGYDPADAGFGQCVGNLTANMDEADYPVE
jgi:hypothetical protein